MQKNAHIDKVREAVSCLFVEGIGDSEYLELLRDGIELASDICMLIVAKSAVKPCNYNVGRYTAQMGKGGRGEK